ncbi:hypothetical protein M3212_04010 [Alkalihalobacillus oceani]|uniref:hypothetical protein n=1 Tax=Halalkalibacter oceani TaxID=1653776 RepID=UPI00203C34E1|nr:hypothetical protein [Halalkalibacter oceani]MCM3759951.1 hypothetical protein [Halalkalibacter oceani]
MKRDKFEIDYPAEQEIKAEIQTIVAAGLEEKDSFYKHLLKLYQQVGFKHLFHNRTELLFLFFTAIALLAFVAISGQSSMLQTDGQLYSFLFITSPLLYILSCLLSFLRVYEHQTYEVEMVCKWSFYDLTAFKMLMFSFVSLLGNAVIIGIVAPFTGINPLFALLISAVALFLFSSFSLYVVYFLRSRLTKYGFAAGWVVMNLLLAGYSAEFYQLFLSRVPVVIYLLLCVASAGMYVASLKKMIGRKREGVM